jgi:hypothetical protein
MKKSNSRNSSCDPLKIKQLLKLSCNQNSIVINHKPNDDFKATLLLEGHKRTFTKKKK